MGIFDVHLCNANPNRYSDGENAIDQASPYVFTEFHFGSHFSSAHCEQHCKIWLDRIPPEANEFRLFGIDHVAIVSRSKVSDKTATIENDRTDFIAIISIGDGMHNDF